MAELHIDNIRLQAKGQDMRKTALKVMHQIRDSLPGLARYVADDPTYDNIKVFVAETLLYRGVTGFGFKVADLPDTRKGQGIALLQKMIMRVYHPAGKNRNNDRMGNKTKLVWISRQRLLEVGGALKL